MRPSLRTTNIFDCVGQMNERICLNCRITIGELAVHLLYVMHEEILPNQNWILTAVFDWKGIVYSEFLHEDRQLLVTVTLKPWDICVVLCERRTQRFRQARSEYYNTTTPLCILLISKGDFQRAFLQCEWH